MARRMLDSSIWANENFAELPPMARLLLIGIINLADDQGRMKAHPAYLRSQVFPYDDVAIEDVREWLAQIEANETILLYEANGKQYLQLLNWWQYQNPAFASPSEHPRPSGWTDRVRYTGKNRIIYTFGWVSAGGDGLPDTCDQDGNPLPSSSVAHGRPHGQPCGQPCGQPHDQPCGQPHGQPHAPPHAPLIDDDDKDKDKDKDDDNDRTRVTTAKPLRDHHHHHPSPAAAERVCSNLMANNIIRKQTPALTHTVNNWLIDYPVEWIDEAIDVAAMARDPTPKYVAGILKNWAAERRQPNGAPPAGKRVVAVPSAAEGAIP